MFNIRRLISSILFVLFLFSTVLAQENRAPVETPREPVASGPLVTATATAKRVRFVSPGTVVQLRLEVYNETGQKLFDTELRGGNVLDWHLQDGAGQRLQTGSYACVLTSKSLSGRLSQRVGLVTVSDKKTGIETAGATQLSTAQQQTIGPVEGNAALTILQESEAEAITTVTHDGAEGQMARTRGALSFRVGDIFSGKDKEQMRLTADGRLGIGTSDPQANLDVAGTIRATEGLMFSDGSTLKVNEKGLLTRTSADGASSSSVASPQAVASTQNRIAKFTDTIGNLGDSGITETAGGLIGIGTTNPQSLLQVGPNTGYGSTNGLLISNNLLGSQFDRAFQLAPRQTANPASNSVLMYALPTINTGVTVPSQYGFFVDGKQGPGAITSYAAIATGQVASLGASNNTHLLLGNLAIPAGNYAIYDNTNFKSFFKGSVGIGTNNPNPSSKLDVVGDINTSTHYRIGGERVFSVGLGGADNTFAGIGAGQANTGGNNTFFGAGAGISNTTGGQNAFFGTDAGSSNTTGAFNSFLGFGAGGSNTTEDANTFVGHRSNGMAGITNATAVGYRAQVTQSDSLVLGSINNVNGGTADTKVGIGTSAPDAKLSVAGSQPATVTSGNGTNAAPVLRIIGGKGGNGTGAGFTGGKGADVVIEAGNGGDGDLPGAGGTIKLQPGFRFGNSYSAVSLAPAGGNVGVGMLNIPGFDVGHSALFLENNSGDPNITLRIDGANNNLYLVARSAPGGQAAGIIFRTATPGAGEIDRMTIGPAGNVGIGTVEPGHHLHVLGAGDQQIAIQSSDTGGRQWTLQSSNGTSSGGRFEIVDRTAVASRLTILANGNVGVGTTSPAVKLHVAGDVAVTTQGSGLILRANDGPKCFLVNVNNLGTLSTAEIICP